MDARPQHASAMEDDLAAALDAIEDDQALNVQLRSLLRKKNDEQDELVRRLKGIIEAAQLLLTDITLKRKGSSFKKSSENRGGGGGGIAEIANQECVTVKVKQDLIREQQFAVPCFFDPVASINQRALDVPTLEPSTLYKI